MLYCYHVACGHRTKFQDSYALLERTGNIKAQCAVSVCLSVCLSVRPSVHAVISFPK